jgi:hypothetical protein
VPITSSEILMAITYAIGCVSSQFPVDDWRQTSKESKVKKPGRLPRNHSRSGNHNTRVPTKDHRAAEARRASDDDRLTAQYFAVSTTSVNDGTARRTGLCWGRFTIGSQVGRRGSGLVRPG